jgi:hypothetical protein
MEEPMLSQLSVDVFSFPIGTVRFYGFSRDKTSAYGEEACLLPLAKAVLLVVLSVI